ncbi:MAG: D-glycero-beta-D-manno-heptose-7-phosphate kinase [Verrucomicrobiales bacterium]|nr:D-glycero-beta-D-manno-heptose-7-phosphate kinase [Verrucomicrobiales bacterium]
MNQLSSRRLTHLLRAARKVRVLIVGDLMLDRFIWGRVNRISPEAPVPVVEFVQESSMPGGAANVARNLTALGAQAEMFGVVGRDAQAAQLRRLLEENHVVCGGLVPSSRRATSVKTRIIASQQQVVRLDRETNGPLEPTTERALIRRIESRLEGVDAVILGDYGKGVVSQSLLDTLRDRCQARGIWLSLDPKPVHHLDLGGLSLITPNRKETFELTGLADTCRDPDPTQDPPLLQAAEQLMHELRPALLLVTLGEAGMLLCRRNCRPFHIPTVALEVFDVSGAGDTVIAAFTLAIAAGASPAEAAILSNLAAGIVVGKVGTATVSPEELQANLHQVGSLVVPACE